MTVGMESYFGGSGEVGGWGTYLGYQVLLKEFLNFPLTTRFLLNPTP